MYLTKKELASRLGVSIGTIYTMRKKGILPQPVQWGPNTLRWSEKEIEQFEEQMLAARPKVIPQPCLPPGRPRKDRLQALH